MEYIPGENSATALNIDRIRREWNYSPLNIGEIFLLTLYRQDYLAAEHRRDFRAYFIQTEFPRR